MTVQTFHELEQGSESWLQARAGIITASTMGALITETAPTGIVATCPECKSPPNEPCFSLSLKEPRAIKSLHPKRKAPPSAPKVIAVADNETSRTLAAYLAAERITGRPNETYQSRAMLRGQLDEPLARYYYSERYHPVEEVGFVLRTEDNGVRVGWSPDGLVHEDGGIEIKSREPHIHIAHVNADKVPAENMAQCQTALYVSGRDWIDYLSFSSGLKLWPKRVYPDPRWQAAIPAAAQQLETNIKHIIDTFNDRTKDCPPTEFINHFEEIVIK